MEAADDICYTIIDFEDGINLGLIPEDYALEYLIKLVKDRIDTGKYHRLAHTEDRLSYLRALAISTLIQDATRVFMENEKGILEGTFSTSLLDKSQYKAQIRDILDISAARVYRSQEVIEKEIAGYRIISDILEAYSGAMVRTLRERATNYDKLVLTTLPETFRETRETLYSTLLQCCCFVASLSDSRAVHIHNKITGKQL